MIGKVTDDQKKYLKDNLLSKIYMNFVNAVATNRKLVIMFLRILFFMLFTSQLFISLL